MLHDRRHPSGEFFLAIDFGGTKIALCTASPDGEAIHTARLDTRADAGADQALERTLVRAGELVEATPGRLAVVAAVGPGIVRPDGVLLAPNVPGWDRLALPARLREAFDVTPIAVGNDVKAAALAESRWGSLRGADPGLLLNLGTGVAIGIVAGGAVLQGAHGAAGEIGYTQLTDDGAGVAGGRAPLEELVGGRAIGERAGRLLGRRLSAEDAFGDEDPGVRALVAGALSELGRQLANAAILVDPQRIAVAGGLMRSAATVLPALADRLARVVPFPPELVPARFTEDGALRGAVALAVDTYDPRRRA
jgi:glucokinase